MSQEKFAIGLIARFKHGDLLRAIRERGWTQKQTAEFLGMSCHSFQVLINLRKAPKQLTGRQRQKLLELTGKTPEELWPAWAFSKEFLEAPKGIEAVREVPAARLLATMQALQLPPATPEELIQDREQREIVVATLRRLPKELRSVIEGIFLEDKTIDDVADRLRISPQGVRRRLERVFHDLRYYRSRFPELHKFAKEMGFRLSPGDLPSRFYKRDRW